MNKRQELDMMILTSKLRVQERVQDFLISWKGEEARDADNPRPFESKMKQPVVMEEQNVSR